jgi:hypothetical protein
VPAPEPAAPKGGNASVSTSAALAPVTAPAAAPVAAAAPRFVAAAPPPRPHLPLSLVDVHEGRLGVGLPAVELRPVYTQKEMAMYGVEQRNEVRVPVFKAAF